MKISPKQFYTKNKFYPSPMLIRGNRIVCPTCKKDTAECFILGVYYSVGECVRCEKKTHKKFSMPRNIHPLPEFTTEAIREGRKQNFNTMIQPEREGIISKEFVEAYPEKARKIYGNMVEKAQYTWRDIPGWSQRQRSQ